MPRTWSVQKAHPEDIAGIAELVATVGGDLEDLRAEVENDLRHLTEHYQLVFDAVLVTGDIAYSGSADQYEKAATWFSRIADMLDFDEANVWMVPGNHDVDWDVLGKSDTLKGLAGQVESTDPADLGALIDRWYIRG